MFSKSKLNDQWRQEGSTRIEVNGSSGFGGKIFGIPWMLFGCYFIYKWVIEGVVEYVKAGDFAGLFSSGWAWLLILAGLAVVFIVPGWMLAFMRRKVIVDVSIGDAEEGNDFRVYRRIKTHSLNEFQRVLLVETVTKSEDSRGNTKKTRFHDVRLVKGKPKEYILVGTMQEEEKAEELGKAVAKITGLPFEIQEKIETRSED